MNSVNLVIKKNYVKSDGTTPVYLQYNFTRTQRRLIKTGRNIDPINWDSKKGKLKKSAHNYDEINKILLSLKHRMEQVIDGAMLKGEVATLDYVESKFNNATGRSHISDDLFEPLFMEFVEFKKSKVSAKMIDQYLNFYKHFKAFSKFKKARFNMQQIDLNFYYSFVDFLENKYEKHNGEIGLQKNSVGTDIRVLRTFIGHYNKLSVDKVISMKNFSKPFYASEDIYLNAAELQQIFELEYEFGTTKRKIRDLFLIGCETGLRFSDLRKLGWHNIEDRIIRVKVQKTFENVVIPISDRVFKILEPYFEDNSWPECTDMRQFNVTMKLIGKEANIISPISKWKVIGKNKTEIRKPKYHFISSHTCRRSFCTNQFLAGMPTILIRKISGHKDEQTFLRYIKINEEEAALKMLEIWSK